jgi:hypothetical protein
MTPPGVRRQRLCNGGGGERGMSARRGSAATARQLATRKALLAPRGSSIATNRLSG